MMDIDVEIESRVRERTAHLEAANRELGIFVAGVAYDLRTPLRAIQGVTSVFTQQHYDESPAGARECIDCIRLNVEQLSRMLDGLARIFNCGWGDLVSSMACSGRIAGKGVQPPLPEEYPSCNTRHGKTSIGESLQPLRREEPANMAVSMVQGSLIAAVDGANLDIALENLRQRREVWEK